MDLDHTQLQVTKIQAIVIERTDTYIVVNPASYTKDGAGYSMVGLMPEMKGKTITIYGFYYDKIDSVKIIVE